MGGAGVRGESWGKRSTCFRTESRLTWNPEDLETVQGWTPQSREGHYDPEVQSFRFTGGDGGVILSFEITSEPDPFLCETKNKR